MQEVLQFMRYYISECGDSMIGEDWRERLDDPGDLSNVHVYQHTYCSVG